MTTKNEVVNVPSSSMLVAQNKYLEKLRSFAEITKIDFTDYEKQCVMNAIRTIDVMLSTSRHTWNSFDVNNIMSVLQQTAFLKLNPSAEPHECYFEIRQNFDKKANVYLPPKLGFGIEGAGNDAILRNFGVKVKDVHSTIIYEGDEYDLGEMNGWDYVLPKHRRTFKTNRILFAVYLIKKFNDEVEVAIASREDVKISLLAKARSNGADDKLIRELAKYSIDELLTNEKWVNYELDKGKYKTPLFGPAWTRPESTESMILRKIRNHAIRRYPKNFNPEIQRLYEATFEDEKYAKQEVTADDTIALNQGVYETEANVEVLDLDNVTIEEKVTSEPEAKPKRQYNKRPKPEPEPEPEIVEDEEAEDTYEDEEEELEELTVTVDDEIEVEGEEADDNDMPDWMK